MIYNKKALNKLSLLSIKDVIEITQISRSTIYRLLNLEKFPKPKKIGNLIRWRYEDIENFINQVEN